MSEDYLWNREGEIDPEVARLEELMERFQFQPDARPLSQARPKPASMRRKYWWWAAGLAAAAMLIVAVSLSLTSRNPELRSSWKCSWNNSRSQAIHSGQVIDTGSGSAARLESELVGEVSVDPNSRLRLVQSTRDEQRLALERGTIHAFIWAPPREFVVDTPSAKTIDLGCQYTLHVAPDGTGSLNVEMGWVAFQWHNLESFIPAGAACTTRLDRGPGVPYFADAPAELRKAVLQFDKSGDLEALTSVIHSARPHDALTLWHLLSRTQGTERAEVFARFSELVKLPPSVTPKRIINGDPAALDTAWNALDLGDTDWWREWKRKW